MGCFVVAEFLLTSTSRGPSAIAEPLVVYCSYPASEFKWINSLLEEERVAAACSFLQYAVARHQTNPYSANMQDMR